MIKERIEKLRQVMRAEGIDVYMVTTNDFHGSEYVGDYFKCRKYITGFTGSAGTAVITFDDAMLWTDGRYFIQAAAELSDSGVKLMKSAQPGVPTIKEYLENNMTEGQVLGFDGRCVSSQYAAGLEKSLTEKGVSIVYDIDLVDKIWEDRPELSKEPVKILDVKYCGESCSSKLKRIRGMMKEKEADIYIIPSLDDIAWLFNIRGNDVECNPVVLSYAVLTQDEAVIYAQAESFSKDVLDVLSTDGVVLKPYNDIYEEIKKISEDKTVIIDASRANYAMVKNIPENVKVINTSNLTQLPKAIKNSTEVENERIAHIKDGVAIVKFTYWLKKNIGKIKITELSAAEYLERLREQGENYMGPSFEPIVAYGANAAMCHYSPTEESDTELKPEGFVLFDTGGQYLEGTTDITRTVALGPCSPEMKKHFTAVLRGHLNLAAARFMYGVRGLNLDYLARVPLWEMGLDYNHGTGHGVGYYLNVHEEPNGFRWKIVPERFDSAVFEEGMITSNEPGFYLEGKYGIRTENLIVCVKDKVTEYGTFMKFENLTMAPIDLDAIDFDSMQQIDKDRLNEYHREVYEKISPYLNDEERAWLKEATRAI
ncbi:MAG: aminopeptidase P family protein [Lachnospiraceae bacterium]